MTNKQLLEAIRNAAAVDADDSWLEFLSEDLAYVQVLARAAATLNDRELEQIAEDVWPEHLR